MKLAHEYKGFYLDVFYNDEKLNGIVQQTQEQIEGLTVEEIINKFKERVNQTIDCCF